jgi:hypothetical protein
MLTASSGFVYAQLNASYKVKRANLGSSGSSQTVITSSGTYLVSQSVGQSSVIGTYKNNHYYLLQGYQQPLYKIDVKSTFESEILAKVYPNPFQQSIQIVFTNPTQHAIFVMIFDIHGKTIYHREFLPSQNLEVNLMDISNGSYFLRVVSNNRHFSSKLIKF